MSNISNNFYIEDINIRMHNSPKTILLSLSLLITGLLAAQGDDDIFEANRLKKVFPDDRVVATLAEEEIEFDRGRSEDKLPVVTANCNTGVNFLSLRERAGIQYYDFYNSFTKITSFKQLEKVKGMFGTKKNYNVGYAIDRSASSSGPG